MEDSLRPRKQARVWNKLDLLWHQGVNWQSDDPISSELTHLPIIRSKRNLGHDRSVCRTLQNHPIHTGGAKKVNQKDVSLSSVPLCKASSIFISHDSMWRIRSFQVQPGDTMQKSGVTGHKFSPYQESKMSKWQPRWHLLGFYFFFS